MAVPKYRDFADFQREHIRPEMRLGWSLDSIVDPTVADLDFDEDPFEQAFEDADDDESEDSDEA
jgi:hypothetical protein